ncbi:hypothetical protein BC828DRAFT_394138, partial [Blastocladiella britannica]
MPAAGAADPTSTKMETKPLLVVDPTAPPTSDLTLQTNAALVSTIVHSPRWESLLASLPAIKHVPPRPPPPGFVAQTLARRRSSIAVHSLERQQQNKDSPLQRQPSTGNSKPATGSSSPPAPTAEETAAATRRSPPLPLVKLIGMVIAITTALSAAIAAYLTSTAMTRGSILAGQAAENMLAPSLQAALDSASKRAEGLVLQLAAGYRMGTGGTVPFVPLTSASPPASEIDPQSARVALWAAGYPGSGFLGQIGFSQTQSSSGTSAVAGGWAVRVNLATSSGEAANSTQSVFAAVPLFNSSAPSLLHAERVIWPSAAAGASGIASIVPLDASIGWYPASAPSTPATTAWPLASYKTASQRQFSNAALTNVTWSAPYFFAGSLWASATVPLAGGTWAAAADVNLTAVLPGIVASVMSTTTALGVPSTARVYVLTLATAATAASLGVSASDFGTLGGTSVTPVLLGASHRAVGSGSAAFPWTTGFSSSSAGSGAMDAVAAAAAQIVTRDFLVSQITYTSATTAASWVRVPDPGGVLGPSGDNMQVLVTPLGSGAFGLPLAAVLVLPEASMSSFASPTWLAAVVCVVAIVVGSLALAWPLGRVSAALR